MGFLRIRSMAQNGLAGALVIVSSVIFAGCTSETEWQEPGEIGGTSAELPASFTVTTYYDCNHPEIEVGSLVYGCYGRGPLIGRQTACREAETDGCDFAGNLVLQRCEASGCETWLENVLEELAARNYAEWALEHH